MKFCTLPIVAILFIALAMVVQFAISFSLEKELVRVPNISLHKKKKQPKLLPCNR